MNQSMVQTKGIRTSTSTQEIMAIHANCLKNESEAIKCITTK